MARIILLLYLAGLISGNSDDDFPGYNLQYLLDVEANYINQFEAYLEALDKERHSIERFLENVHVAHEKLEDPEEYFGNPLNAFKAISRFANNWSHEVIGELLVNDTFAQYEEGLSRDLKRQRLDEPEEEHLLSAAEALLQWQQLAGLPTAELANAVLFTDEQQRVNLTLSASECYIIGSRLTEVGRYHEAAEWLLQARKIASREVLGFPNVSLVLILERLVVAVQALGNSKLANKFNNEILKIEPKNEEALSNKLLLQRELSLNRIGFSYVEEEAKAAEEEEAE